MNIKTTFAFIGALGIAASAIAAEEIDITKLPPASDRKDVAYEKDIKPIFDKSCIECHGEVKPKGKLRLDSREAAVKGGISGKVIEVGDSTKSGLVHNIAFIGPEDLWMPPPDDKKKFPKLTSEEVGLVRAWIDQGAK